MQVCGLPSASVQGGDGCQQLPGLEAETPPLFAYQEHESGPPHPTRGCNSFTHLLPAASYSPGAPTHQNQNLLRPCRPPALGPQDTSQRRWEGWGWLRLASHSI